MQGPKGKYIFGLVKIGDKGQIVIPKEARDVFGLKPGDQLLLAGDEKQGMILVDPVSSGLFKVFQDSMLNDGAGQTPEAGCTEESKKRIEAPADAAQLNI